MDRDDRAVCFGQVPSFVCNADRRKKHALNAEKTRLVVLSFDVPAEGYPVSCYLDFYKDESKYRRGSVCHRLHLDANYFCGLISGIHQRQSTETYIAFMFTTFTAFVILRDYTEERTKHLITTCKTMTEQYFGFYKTCPIKFLDYPKEEKKVFMKESRNQVVLNINKNRVSICSDMFFHLCLYTWPLSVVAIYLQPPKMQLEVNARAEHPGTYSFLPMNCLQLKDIISKIKSLTIYEPVIPSNVRSLPSAEEDEYPSTSSSSPASSILSPSSLSVFDFSTIGIPGTPENLSESESCSTNSTYHELNSNLFRSSPDEREDSYEQYLTMTRRTDNPRVFEFDVNDYVDKRMKAVKQMLRSCSEAPIQSSQATLDGINPACGLSTPLQELLAHNENVTDREACYAVWEDFCKWVTGRTAGRDTLQLKKEERFKLCTRLYAESSNTLNKNRENWEVLGQYIGLCSDAIALIKTTIRQFFLPYPAAEVVLCHWQYMYNQYGHTGPTGKCPVACDKQNLLQILKKLEQSDLIDLLQEDSRQ